MFQAILTILFVVVFVQLAVALSLYIWLTIYGVIKQSRNKPKE